MKVALVHDQLAEFGGAERVLIAMKKAFPEAPLYTSFVDKSRLGKHYDNFKNWEIHESFIGKLPFFGKLYSPLRFLLPLIWSSFDLSKYDVVLCSSSWGMAKGVSLRQSKEQRAKSKEKFSSSAAYRLPPTTYFCYLHTPPRYLYGYDESTLKKYWPVKVYALFVNHFLRKYDYRSSQTVDKFIFNSEEIRRRSLKFYRKDGIVLHPPIRESGQGSVVSSQEAGQYYLTVSRLAPTKHIDLLIKAANEMRFSLKIVGSGSQEKYLKSIAGETVEFVGNVDDSKLDEIYSGAKAFLYASVNEDFGMVPVEAMAHGVPVIAYASGGVKETVVDSKTGITYHELTTCSLQSAISRYESLDSEMIESLRIECKKFAATCDEALFIKKINDIVFDNG